MSDKHIDGLVSRNSKLGFSFRGKPNYREQKIETTELKKENEELQSESIYSTVVKNMYNKKGFDNIVIPEVSNSLRDHHNHYVAFLDADGLKAINDIFGHDKGSEMLDLLGQVIKKEFRRAGDVACHIFGTGDEYLISSREKDNETFIHKLNQLREKFEMSVAGSFGNVRPTFSFGVAKISEYIVGDYSKEAIKSGDVEVELHKKYTIDAKTLLDDAISVAEMRMYEDKRERKTGRI